MKMYDVIIVGGGLAGLTCALDLSIPGLAVLVIEKDTYPKHKVCGEYISNEVTPYLERLGIDISNTKADPIQKLTLSNLTGNLVETDLPLGGFGISRYALDHLLYRAAKTHGAEFKFETVSDIVYNDDQFYVKAKDKEYKSKLVIGSYGKRSSLDKKFKRDFIQQKTPWIGIKAHYRNEDFPQGEVHLHNFNGGYCGLSRTETGAINLCYLAHYQNFKQAKSIDEFNHYHLAQNPYLKSFLETSTLEFEQHLAISQVSFQKKNAVVNHVLMAGDSAGLIHPLCGNGMAMAIHSAKLISDEIKKYQVHKRRDTLEENYKQIWKKTFQKRLIFGSMFQKILLRPGLTNFSMSLVSNSRDLLQKMIQQTHGKPIL